MKRSIIISVVFIIILSALLLLHPYNFFHYFNAEKRVMSMLESPTVRDGALGESSEIVNIKYLGSHMYHIETEENEYVLEIKTSWNTSKQTLNVFEHKQHITQFISR